MINLLALGSVTQGDRIWWTWNGLELDDDFSLQRISSDRDTGILPANTCCKSPEAVFRTILKTVGVFSDTLDSYGLGILLSCQFKLDIHALALTQSNKCV